MYKDYNMNHLVLPLDLEVKLQENDIAFTIHHLVESIPNEAFASFLHHAGCPSYHPRMMLKLILCGYTQSTFSGRKIEALVKDSLRMMWLAQGYEPSYRTINRFRVHPQMKELLRQCFVQFRCQLVKEKLINEEAIFIDGTKIEANANKFTFVWKKSVDNHHARLVEQSNQLYAQLLEAHIIPEIEKESEKELTIDELAELSGQLEQVVEAYTEKIDLSTDVNERKQLRRERKTPKQQLKKVKDWLLRKQQYKRDAKRCGDRNSYSKTDHDATFMRMKEDYMKNGQLKPGYNIQLATEGQYALAYGVYPNPTDTKTLIPFLDDIEENYFELPEHIVADAGYGSEQNYDNILTNRERIPLITYNQYRKEQKKKTKTDPFQVSNWAYDEENDSYTCPNNKRIIFQRHTTRTDKATGFERKYKVYESEDCTGCPFKAKCSKADEGKNRTLMINERWEQQKAYVRAKLSEEETGAIYRQRKIDVEPVFGFLKANLGFTRFNLRGKWKVEHDIGLALMAVNLRKYAVRE